MTKSELPPRTPRSYRYIYEIVNHDKKVVYVGLTCNPKRRSWMHKNDPRMIKAFGDVNFEVIFGPIPVAEASELEGTYLDFYASFGYTPENRKKTGGIGATTSVWDFDLCVAEGKKYATRTYFQQGSPAAYKACVRNGWLPEVCAHMVPHPRKIKLTFEYCRNRALRYHTRTEFAFSEDKSAYSTARAKGWLDKICAHMVSERLPNGTLTKDWCASKAKKCNTKTEFRTSYVSEYSVAHKEGWIEEICSHMVPLVKRGPPWSHKRTRAEALKYATRTAFYKGNNPAYNAARRNGWLDEFFPLKNVKILRSITI